MQIKTTTLLIHPKYVLRKQSVDFILANLPWYMIFSGPRFNETSQMLLLITKDYYFILTKDYIQVYFEKEI